MDPLVTALNRIADCITRQCQLIEKQNELLTDLQDERKESKAWTRSLDKAQARAILGQEPR